jgi:murein DD-endopeptidase MepM/ murein hydrolase activator NlpD
VVAASLLVGLLAVPVAASASSARDAGAPSPLDPVLRFPMTMPVTGKVESLIGGGCPTPRSHSGVDISSPLGTAAEIRAAYAGFATASQTGNGYGLTVDVVHGPPEARYVSRYAHLSQALIPPGGAWVDQGDVIGMMGATGNAQIVHLHFEVRDATGAVVDLNPAFRPCGRQVTVGAPVTVELGSLRPPAADALAALAVNTWAAMASTPEPTAPAGADCRYWGRGADRSTSRCGADPGDLAGLRVRRADVGAGG